MSAVKKTIEERLDDLEKKIDYINKILGVNSKQEVDPDIPPIPKISAPPKETLSTRPTNPLNLLPILAVICFFLASVFIVKLTIESGWLTPERQWGLLVLFGVALTGFSLIFRTIEASYRSYAGAAGIIVLYIAAYSSYLYFGLFSPILAMTCGGIVSFLCLYLFYYFKSQLFVVVCCIGTYISPVLLNKEADLIYLSAFFLIWAYLFSRMAIYFKTRTLTMLASYLGLGVFTFLNLSATSYENVLNVILVQSMQFIIYAGGVYSYSVKNQSYLSREEAIAYLPILLFFYGTVYYFLNIYNPLIAPWVSLGFAGFIYLLYWSARRTQLKLESENLVQSFFSVVLFHSGYVQLMPMEGKPWLLPTIILGIYLSEQKEKLNSIGLPLRAMFSAIAIIEFFKLCFELISSINEMNVVPAFFTIAMGFFYYLKGARTIKNQEGLFLSLLHILVILALYRIAYSTGSLAVTSAWGIYSALVLGFGYLKKHAVLAKSSLVVLMIATLKALVYDASRASSLTRIGSLILTGIVLYGAGYMLQKINKWKHASSEI